MIEIDRYSQVADKCRLNLIRMGFEKNKSVHYGGCFSCIDILSVLYGGIIDNTSDVFLLSKGHAAPALYMIMNAYGMLSDEELDTYRMDGSELGELMEYNPAKGFYVSGGSLGLGLSYAAGIAMKNKRLNKKGRVFCLVGDGELDEGSVWEAIHFSGQNNLNNLNMIIDVNHIQSDDFTDNIQSWRGLEHVFAACGWKTVSINGNDCAQVYEVLKKENDTEFPVVILADTVKGKGVSYMENNIIWHDWKMNTTEFQQAEEELSYVNS